MVTLPAAQNFGEAMSIEVLKTRLKIVSFSPKPAHTITSSCVQPKHIYVGLAVSEVASFIRAENFGFVAEKMRMLPLEEERRMRDESGDQEKVRMVLEKFP